MTAANTGPDSTWQERLSRWWAEFSLQTKLLVVATMVVSLLMTGITFLALNGIQRDAQLSDTRYARDLGLLLSANVTPLVAEGNDRELAAVADRFWRSSRSLRYIFFADPEGIIYLGIPIGGNAGSSELLLSRRLELPADIQKRPDTPLIRQHLSPDGRVTDVFVPMVSDGNYFGVLALGINPNETLLTSAALTREVTVAVFVSIWVLVILGAVFNALTITRPVKELLQGVRSIASGNFETRLSLPVGGELGELLGGFNTMASQLEVYKAANIEELTAAQVKQQTLIATMADGAVLLDADGSIVLVNPTARRLFRWEGRNLEGNELIGGVTRTPRPRAAGGPRKPGGRCQGFGGCALPVWRTLSHAADCVAIGSGCEWGKPQGHRHDHPGPHPRGGAQCGPEPVH